MSTYRTVVIDPPWPQKGGGTLKGREGWGDAHGASMPLRYDLMSVPEIAALPIRELTDPTGAHVYLWTTNGFLPDAFNVLRAWGFTYSTTLVWAKTPMGGGLGGSFGISTEYLVHGRRGVIREHPIKARSRVRGTWKNWKRPYDNRGKPRGSAKPPQYRTEWVEAASPGPYLELFARDPWPGWDSWGDQAVGAVSLPCLDGRVAS